MEFQRKSISEYEVENWDELPNFSQPQVFKRVPIDEESPFITAWKRPPTRVPISELSSDVFSICFNRNEHGTNIWAQIQAVKALERHNDLGFGLTRLD